MTHSDDPMNVLRRFITDEQADRILSSVSDTVAADDDGLAPMVNLLTALQSPGTTDELSGHEDLLTQMRTAMQAPVASLADSSALHVADDAGLLDLLPATPLPRRNTMLAKIVTGKVAALAAVGIFSVGAAAAATGTLPTPVQRSVSNAASHVGLDLPEPSHSVNDSFRSSTGDDDSSSSLSASSSSSPSTSTVTTLPSSASRVAVAAVNSRCDVRHSGSDDTGSYYGSSSSTSTTIASAASPACTDDKGVDPANHDAGDDKGGTRVAGSSDDNSGSGSGSSGSSGSSSSAADSSGSDSSGSGSSGSGSSGRRGGSDDSITSTSTPSNTATTIDDHGGDNRTSSTTSSRPTSPATVTSIDDHGGKSSGSGSGSSGSGSNSGKG